MKKRREVGGEVVLTSLLLLEVACCALVWLVSLVRILGNTFGKTMPSIPVSNDNGATSGGTPSLREDCRDKFVGDADVAGGEWTEDRRRMRAVVGPRGEETVLPNSPEEVREGGRGAKKRVTWGWLKGHMGHMGDMN